MKHEPLILPTTAADGTTVADTKQLNTTEADKVLILATAALAGAEVVNLFVFSSANTLVPVYNGAGTQAQLNATTQSIMVEGGFIYGVQKSATAGATGVDYYLKPRR